MKNLKKFFAVLLSALILSCSAVPVSAAENEKSYFQYCHSYGNPDTGMKSYIDFVIPLLSKNPRFTFDNYYIYFFMYNGCYSFGVIDTSFLNHYGDLKISYYPLSREYHGIHIPYTGINPLSSDNYSFVNLSNLISTRDFDHGSISGVTTMLYTDNFINLYFTSYVDASSIRHDGDISDYFVFHSSFLNDSDSDSDFPDSVPFPMDVKGFSEFYAVTANGYLSKLNNALSSNFSTSNIIDFLTYFSNYGGSVDSIYNSRELLKKYVLNNLSEHSSYCSTVYDVVRQHYRDYLKMKSLFLPDVKPSVNDDDTLITDSDDDTIDISLLREIVRLLTLIYNRLNYGLYDVNNNLVSMGDKLLVLNNSINNLDVSADFDLNPLITRLDDLIDLNTGSSGDVPDLEKLFIIDFDSPVYDEYMIMIQDKFYQNDYDNLPSLDDYLLETSDPVLLSSVDDNSLLSDNLNHYRGVFEPPVIRFKKPMLDGYSIFFSDDEIDYIDFSGKRWTLIVNLCKGIIGCLVLLFFSKWIVKYVPSLISGYGGDD